MATLVDGTLRRKNMIKAALLRWYGLSTKYTYVEHIKGSGADFYGVDVKFMGETNSFTVDFKLHKSDENATFKTFKKETEKVFS